MLVMSRIEVCSYIGNRSIVAVYLLEFLLDLVQCSAVLIRPAVVQGSKRLMVLEEGNYHGYSERYGAGFGIASCTND